MCTISMVGDNHGGGYWPNKFPEIFPKGGQIPVAIPPEVTKKEFQALKKEVEALKKLLKAAKIYDEETGQKDCEQGDKVAILKAVAKLAGVDLKDIFPDA
jgi:3-mercaptopyruvate sulfurtransferase SseA